MGLLSKAGSRSDEIRNGMDSSPPLATKQRVRRLCARMVAQPTILESEEEPVNKITRAGVDIAKSVFHVCATDRYGNKLWQAKLSRKNWLKRLEEHLEPGSEIGMCSESHLSSARTANIAGPGSH